jgi:hypothetical protein
MGRASRAVARTAFLALGSVATLCLCGCASDSSDETSSESTPAPANAGGDPGMTKSCKDRYVECHRGCDAMHPWSKDSARALNSEHRTVCQNACNADYRLCREPAARLPPGGPIPPKGP